MNAPDQTLRPLGIGEVLDRAVTLCVRHFVPLALIFVVYAVPYAVVQFFATREVSSFTSTLASVLQSPGARRDPHAIANALGAAPHLNGWYPALLALAFFVGPLPAAALIVACNAFYFRREVSLVRAYRTALGRWLPLIGVNLLYVVAGIVLYAAVALLAVALVLATIAVTAALHGLGIALAVVIALVVGLVALGFFIVAALAVQVSYFTCVVEGTNGIVAFSRGIGRVFGAGLGRSLLVGAAFFAIAIGIGLVSLLGESVVAGVLHSAAAGTAYATVVRVATAAFATAFIAIFYYDLRVREEGFDLAYAADAARDASLATT